MTLSLDEAVDAFPVLVSSATVVLERSVP
jgi:hypothetical protein